MRLACGVLPQYVVPKVPIDLRTTLQSAHTVSVGLLGDQLKRRAPDLDCLIPASADDHHPVGRETDRPAAVCMRDRRLWLRDHVEIGT